MTDADLHQPPFPFRPWAAVMGLGAWRPGFPDVRASHDQSARPDADVPPARLPPRLRRRTSLLVRMIAEVAAQASEQAGLPLGAMPIVVGSAYGELGTTMELLHELTVDRAVSPFRFHNSVHNTASGYLSIAHENRRPATSLAAGEHTAAMVLLEAMTVLAERGGDVLVVLADETLPAALTSPIATPASAAMILRARPRDGDEATFAALDRDALAWLGDLRPGPAAPPIPAERAADDDGGGRAFLRLLSAVVEARAQAHPCRVQLTPGIGGGGWSIAVASSSRGLP